MNDSILSSVKKLLGIDESYTVFDPDITLYVNAALATLQQIGVGPQNGFMITDASATWTDFLGDNPVLNPAKMYVVMRTRMSFDPPDQQHVAAAMQAQIKELEWRLEVARMPFLPVSPPVEVDPYVVYVLDGGGEHSEG